MPFETRTVRYHQAKTIAEAANGPCDAHVAAEQVREIYEQVAQVGGAVVGIVPFEGMVVFVTETPDSETQG